MPHGSGTETGECHVHHEAPWTCALLGMSSMSTIQHPALFVGQ